MQTIRLEDRIIYRAAKGKKVKFVNDKRKFTENVVKYSDKRKVAEVDKNGNVVEVGENGDI